jgi:hypothetical protein
VARSTFIAAGVDLSLSDSPQVPSRYQLPIYPYNMSSMLSGTTKGTDSPKESTPLSIPVCRIEKPGPLQMTSKFDKVCVLKENLSLQSPLSNLSLGFVSTMTRYSPLTFITYDFAHSGF